MRDPTVVCVMLANGRREMVKRAVASFREQTYTSRCLLIFDTSEKYETLADIADPPQPYPPSGNVQRVYGPKWRGRSIGVLRNAANSRASWPSILIHWDSDDRSHPNRIAEQVALLQSSGAECVGYNEMLFWQQTQKADPMCLGSEGEAWLYTGPTPQYCLGTSMCYWRTTWEKNQFPDTNAGCDDLYWHGRGIRMVAESSVMMADAQPRMIAAIHGGNTCGRIDPAGAEWRREVEWDAYCRERMQL